MVIKGGNIGYCASLSDKVDRQVLTIREQQKKIEEQALRIDELEKDLRLQEELYTNKCREFSELEKKVARALGVVNREIEEYGNCYGLPELLNILEEKEGK